LAQSTKGEKRELQIYWATVFWKLVAGTDELGSQAMRQEKKEIWYKTNVSIFSRYKETILVIKF
jgi:hypothetical protein